MKKKKNEEVREYAGKAEGRRGSTERGNGP